MDKKKYKTVSVIIPVYNAENTIKKCIESLINNNYPSDLFEIIIIDNCSTDKTIEILKSYNDKIKLLTCSKKGPSAARNKGLLQAAGDIIILTDADCIVSNNFIITHVEAHNEFKLIDTKVKIIGGGIYGINKNFWSICDDFCSWYKQHPGIKEKYIKTHPSANFSFPKNLLNEIGMFDEDLFSAEDYDFCKKARKKDYKIFFKPKAIVYHFNRTSFKDFMTHAAYWSNTQYLLRKKGIVTINRNNIFSTILYYSFFINLVLGNVVISAFKVRRFHVILFLPFIIINKFILILLETKNEIKYILEKQGT